jgi:8-oxo-dGTP pyrophosphatase MutT (NUDIX family)
MSPFIHKHPVRRESDGSETALTVAAVGSRNGRYLLVEERIDSHTVINQPAGHVDPGEDLVTAVIREAREETARQFEPVAVTGVYLWRHPQKPKQFLRVAIGGEWHQSFTRRCRWTRASSRRTGGAAGAELRQAPLRLRSPMVLRCIADYRRGKAWPLSLANESSLAELIERATRL